MKTLHLQKNNRLFLWLLLFVLAAILFVLLRTSAAGHDQNAQSANGTDLSDYQNQSSTGLEPASPQNTASLDTSQSSSVGSTPMSPPSEVPPSQEPSYPIYCPQYLRFSESNSSCPYPPCKPTNPSSQPSADVVMCVY